MINTIISNFSKLFAYDWNDVFSKLKASDKEIPIPASVTTDIKTGAIFSIILNIILVVIGAVIMLLISLFAGGLKGLLVILGVIIVMAIPITVGIVIAIIVINYLTGDQIRKPLAYIIVLILVALGVFGSFLNLLSGLAGFNFLSLIQLGTFLVTSAGSVSIAVGCIDFCLEANK